MKFRHLANSPGDVLRAFVRATGTTTRTAPSACPTCQKPLDAHDGVGKRVPRAGDFGICVHCGELLRFTERSEGGLGVQKAPEDEVAKLDPNERKAFAEVQALFRAARPS